MKFPRLTPIERDREYHNYSEGMRAQVVYGYLFKGISHRDLDSKVLGLNPDYSKGYQAMGILHFLGVKNEHKNFFKDSALDEAITILEQDRTQDCTLVLEHLAKYDNESGIQSAKQFEDSFSKAIEKSQHDTTKNRKERLKNAPKKPSTLQVKTTAFQRNADVVAEVLLRANGICEECSQPAPFVRKKDNSPYLEVHHLIPLASGGNDTVENAVALCPNCHRKMHFG